ncbi:5-oxoprolinase subunit B family protein [Thalassovita taeanensis]|uniref:Sensor histidine kinase inhibitor, KipI family n=1 Tax=Thalassovita taeanensis TaxID=657014 RepID=A0A1H9AGB4_9RHOB|nr:carboxyltransferase domain-containing protein [Thalassovita taeanensis]SEP75463.1 sensor histidine kinase inhibitor, KipI family [Thalassovita taeanensis]
MTDAFPRIAPVGLSGIAISFADTLSEPANRAALAFRAAIDSAGWDGVEESSTSLTSAFLRFDPLHLTHDDLTKRLTSLITAQDWYAAPLPTGRRHFRIPCVFGTDLAPQFSEAAQAAGLTEAEALHSLTAARPRVLTIGFAPGQPYTGQLGPEWDIPRLKTLTPSVPQGALVVAIRQLIIFSNATPTGWRHIGQTAFRCFRPEAPDPFALRPGDELSFTAITPEELHNIRNAQTTNGGARIEAIA